MQATEVASGEEARLYSSARSPVSAGRASEGAVGTSLNRSRGGGKKDGRRDDDGAGWRGVGWAEEMKLILLPAQRCSGLVGRCVQSYPVLFLDWSEC